MSEIVTHTARVDLTASQHDAPTEEERIWALAAHASPLLGFSFLGPIVVLLVKGRDSRWVRAQTLESLNFNITCFAVMLLGMALTVVFVGFFLVLAALGANVVLSLVAAVAAWQGKAFRYPATVRLIKD